MVKPLDVVCLTAFLTDMMEFVRVEDGVVGFPEVYKRLGVQVALRKALP